ncbi:MAG: prepilin-type N-terminal cleavage/methylation domain-containing protein [Phycisphaeraceae bacterium]|nr:prepilin-type N-terminal cleavage/methylation domain-containing protein [Phycisphaeraceae bacterium]
MLRRKPLRGFTLIELLVVISIITLLVSILLPALRQARQHARIANCAVNQRTIAQANMAYAADEDGWFVPPVAGTRNPGSTSIAWRYPHYLNWQSNAVNPLPGLNGGWTGRFLLPYMSDGAVFFDPMNAFDLSYAREGYKTGIPDWVQCSYSLLWGWGGCTQQTPKFQGARRLEEATSRIPLICDTLHVPGTLAWLRCSHPFPGAAEISLGFGYQRPGDLSLPSELRLNAVYSDGHASTWKPSEDGRRYYTGTDGAPGSSQYYYLPTPDE